MAEPWFQRTFTFDTPLERMPCILERLRGTPLRAAAKVAGITTARLTTRIDNTWSIQENLGHLADLESLWLDRLDDFAAGAPTLRPTDLTNARTWNAGHNDRPIADVLASFRDLRARFVDRLKHWPSDQRTHTALHPRLQVPMRPIDHALFVAEHDDHHLARIHTLLTLIPPSTQFAPL